MKPTPFESVLPQSPYFQRLAHARFLALFDSNKTKPLAHSSENIRGYTPLRPISGIVSSANPAKAQLHPIGNSVGLSGGMSAIFSSSGYFARSGSGTFTFAPFNMLTNCSAFTTPFPR